MICDECDGDGYIGGFRCPECGGGGKKRCIDCGEDATVIRYGERLCDACAELHEEIG